MSEQHVNGKLTDFLMDFKQVENKIDDIHSKVGNVHQSTRHLDQLPNIANSLKTQTRNDTLTRIAFFILLLVLLIKGTSMKINIPGWLEINGNQNP